MPERFSDLNRTEKAVYRGRRTLRFNDDRYRWTRPNVLKLHSYCVKNIAGPIANVVLASEVGNALVTMFGAIASPQKAQVRKQ